MNRFVTVHPFLEHGNQPLHIGRLVANHDFVKALLRYGTWDEYVFSGPSVSNLRAFEAAVEQWPLDEGRKRQVRCVAFPQLSDLLRRRAHTAMHVGGWGYFMPGLHYLRGRLGCNHWPITGVTHSLHGRDVIDDAVRLSHAVMSPADAIFCTSRDGLEALKRLLQGASDIAGRRFEGRLLHVPLGIDDGLFVAAGDGARARARLRIPDAAVVLLTLGRLTPSQKMDLGPWLRVFAQRVVPAASGDVYLLLAGGGSPAEIKLVKETADRLGIGARVRIHANFPVEQKPDVLACADVLVSPVDNTQETFGLSLVEAMAAGLPVVASRYDGYKDIVRDGLDGFLIDTIGLADDPAQQWFDLLAPNVAQLLQSQAVAIDLDLCAARVLELVNDEGKRRQMGEHARERASAEFRMSRMIAAYEAHWLELAATAAPRVDVGRNPWSLDPGRVFAHYASSCVGDDLLVQACGRTVDERPYVDVSPFLQLEHAGRFMELAARPMRVGDLRRQAALDVPSFNFLLVWMLKYGFLRRAEGGPS
jgi:glycosyltransferase involved in cell wall biosynthesis